MLVPLITMTSSAVSPRAALMSSPGATTSGFRRSSRVGPYEDAMPTTIGFAGFDRADGDDAVGGPRYRQRHPFVGVVEELGARGAVPFDPRMDVALLRHALRRDLQGPEDRRDLRHAVRHVHLQYAVAIVWMPLDEADSVGAFAFELALYFGVAAIDHGRGSPRRRSRGRLLSPLRRRQRLQQPKAVFVGRRPPQLEPRPRERRRLAFPVQDLPAPASSDTSACPPRSRSFPADFTTTRPGMRPPSEKCSNPSSSAERPSCAPAFIPWLMFTTTGLPRSLATWSMNLSPARCASEYPVG